MQVERLASASSGARVSNAYLTYPEVWNNWAKVQLIPDTHIPCEECGKINCFGMGLRSIS
ncbi:hypothetical protein GCM10008957_56970 [Deinococcus ruber]|uniref:Uncharacterized protein n=1 Tax=Deinococcus ruber TaxID=1848197 RepID=A0A918KXQ1_9DEIO|nr:hypothetical protein GCM10008957_56970 [Deinococcus ruber]